MGAGGALGSMLRYLVSVYFQKTFPSGFPWGTFVVNITGCLLIGLVFGLSERYQWFTEQWRIFLAVGICGGYTTFSAFAIENMKLLQTGAYINFMLYGIGSVVLGIVAVTLTFRLITN